MDKDGIMAIISANEFLAHYGIKGMKKGERRFQNEDGSLTPEGMLRYGVGSKGDARRLKKAYNSASFIETQHSSSASDIFRKVDKLYSKQSKLTEKAIKSNADEKKSAKTLEKSLLIQQKINKNIEKGNVYVQKAMAANKFKNGIDQQAIDKGYSIIKKYPWRSWDHKFFGSAVVYKVAPVEERKYKFLKQEEDDNNFLAQSGIKGQKWGVRRFQNEDGSLTPEGRKRYGLKADYGEMTDQQLREAIQSKKTQNKYVDLMTKDITKKQSDISAFIKSASGVAGKSVELVDKTFLESEKNYADKKIKDIKDHSKALVDQRQKALKDNSKADVSLIDKQIKDNSSEIDKYKQTKDYIKLTGDLSKQAAKAPGEHADLISKRAMSGELQARTAEAYRNINEMEPEQLKKVVERKLLEKEYDELVNPPKPSMWEKGREAFQTLAAVLGVLVAATTIWRNVKGIKKDSDLDDGSEFLSHYGVPGMQKGKRRYQNEDGTLTPEGYRHYGIDPNGRRITEAQAIIEKQRAQQKAQRMALRSQTKQNAYTQKIQARAAIREARTQAQMQRIQAREQLREQQAQNKEDLRVKAESRENLRKNIIKGVAATAAIVGAVMIGRHILKERALNAAHMRDIEKTSILGKQRMAELTEQNRLGILKENNRMTEAKWSREDTFKNATSANVAKDIPKTGKIPKNDIAKDIPKTEKMNNIPLLMDPSEKIARREKVNSNASKIVRKRKEKADKKLSQILAKQRRRETINQWSRRKKNIIDDWLQGRRERVNLKKAARNFKVASPGKYKLPVPIKHSDIDYNFEELWRFGMDLLYKQDEQKS